MLEAASIVKGIDLGSGLLPVGMILMLLGSASATAHAHIHTPLLVDAK